MLASYISSEVVTLCPPSTLTRVVRAVGRLLGDVVLLQHVWTSITCNNRTKKRSYFLDVSSDCVTTLKCASYFAPLHSYVSLAHTRAYNLVTGLRISRSCVKLEETLGWTG